MTKTEMLRAIEARFKEQGGTGVEGWMHVQGCYCAVGALVQAKYTGASSAKCWDKYAEFSTPEVSVLDVMHAHDLALAEVNGELDGVEIVAGNPRALIGTSAYDYVMDQIKKVLA